MSYDELLAVVVIIKINMIISSSDYYFISFVIHQ